MNQWKQNAKVPPFKRRRGRGARFEQLRGHMSIALSLMAQRRRKAKYSNIIRESMLKVPPFLKNGNQKQGRGARFELLGGDMCSSEDSSVDRISMLPDVLLGLILSHLTFKEHVATSILSRRWRYLWTSTTTKLDFDGRETLVRSYNTFAERYAGRVDGLTPEEEEEDDAQEEKDKMNYVNWVNHVLQSRKRLMLEDFKVKFILSKHEAGCIDDWLRYALACKVQTLELDLDLYMSTRTDEECYVFPCKFLQENSSNSLHFKQLRKVLLNYVHVDGKGLEFFLHNCPLLEDLSVRFSSKLSTLRVAGPLPSLKRLEIGGCSNLRSFQICDVNLVYLKYLGQRIDFHLENLPMLVNLCVRCNVLTHMKETVVQFSSILEQIEILKLHVLKLTFCLPVKMSNLKQLEVNYGFARHESFLPVTNMIRSAPCLQKFVFQANHDSVKFRKGKVVRRMVKEELYSELKEVKFVGFRGLLNDFEFVYHFVDNAHALEKIVIDQNMDPYDRRNDLEKSYGAKGVITAMDQAEKKLGKDIPKNIQVEFLSRF